MPKPYLFKLDNWFNELKLHWTSLNLNDANLSNASSLDVVISSIELLEKHLDILNEQKSVTSDAIDKTLVEGEALLDYLREITNKPEQNGESQSSNSKQPYSNSYLHLDGKICL